MDRRRLNLAILISGRGSNMAALIAACRSAAYPARVAVVIADNPEAAGLNTAREAGIATAVVDRSAFPARTSFEQELQGTLTRFPVDLICLAGFMRLLSADFVATWPDRIINIHPSLLPAYKGLDTHARALADGATETGCTVHFVRPAMDAGPIILQRRIPILRGDTPETLAARVLTQEHEAYPEAVRMIATGRIAIVNERVEIRPEIVCSKSDQKPPPKLQETDAMAHANQNSEADPQEIARARDAWANFTVFLKWSTIVTIAFLALLALFTL